MNKIIEKSGFYSEVFMQEDGIVTWKSTQFNRRLDLICFNYFFQLLMMLVKFAGKAICFSENLSVTDMNCIFG